MRGMVRRGIPRAKQLIRSDATAITTYLINNGGKEQGKGIKRPVAARVRQTTLSTRTKDPYAPAYTCKCQAKQQLHETAYNHANPGLHVEDSLENILPAQGFTASGELVILLQPLNDKRSCEAGL